MAEFIGEANFLPGTVTEGKLILAGSPPAPLPEGTEALGQVTVMIRPEQVVVGPTPQEAITLDGRIEDLVFYGTDTHVGLRLQNGSTLSL